MVYHRKGSGKDPDLCLSGCHVDVVAVYGEENAFEERWYYLILSSQLMA
jgi:hypothetical protein